MKSRHHAFPKELIVGLKHLADGSGAQSPWEAEVSIAEANLQEWAGDLFVYTHEQLIWVLPRLMLMYAEDVNLCSQTAPIVMALLRFLDAEKSRDEFYGEEDDWPGGRLSESKKERFARFDGELSKAILDWLRSIDKCELDEAAHKEARSAIKYWKDKAVAGR
jgi:hypothetical protein